MTLGLWIPPHRTRAALDDLAGELAPLAQLLDNGSRIQMVRFAQLDYEDAAILLSRALSRAGIRYDSSVAANPTPMTAGRTSTIREQPYFYGGGYQPMSFDIRVPTGMWNADGWVEIISSIGGRAAVAGGSSNFNAWRQGLVKDRLPALLDFKRMEAYFQKLQESPLHAQSYHQYRVYNWPPPAPSPRCTFMDCGALDEPLSVWRWLRDLQRVQQKSDEPWRVVTQAELLVSASTEAAKRCRGSRVSVLHEQVKEHRYLAGIHGAGPLRADIQDFADFVGAELGSALELGSGYGQLAHYLASRSQRYVRLDLMPHMFVERMDGRLSGLVADIHSLPFQTSSLDTIIANNVLEHAYDPRVSLAEIQRTLRPAGRLYALIPLDALEPDHCIRTHLWKTDERGIRLACHAAGLHVRRLTVIDLSALGVTGAFPTCRGLVAKVEAEKSPEAC